MSKLPLMVDDPLALGSQRRRQLREGGSGHQAERVGILEDLLRRHRGRAELADDDAGGPVRERDGRRVIRAGRAGQREGGDHRVARAADVEHFSRQRRLRELLGAIPAAERDAVRAQRQHDVRAELGRERRERPRRRLLPTRLLASGRRSSARDSFQLGVR